MSKSTNMEHVRALYRMANESWRGSPEFAALTAAIVSLSTPQPPAEERKGNTPITELIADYESNGCDHSDMEWVRRAALHYVDTMQDSQVRCLLYTLASTPADGGFTAGDMMVARQEGRREARRRAAMFGPAATLTERVAGVATLLDGHGPMAESAAAALRNALASYDVAVAGQQGDRND